MTSEEVNRRFEILGFDFPETKEQLKQFDEMFKDYPFKLNEAKIDPFKIINRKKW